jgi:hypothetical protein
LSHNSKALPNEGAVVDFLFFGLLDALNQGIYQLDFVLVHSFSALQCLAADRAENAENARLYDGIIHSKGVY